MVFKVIIFQVLALEDNVESNIQMCSFVNAHLINTTSHYLTLEHSSFIHDIEYRIHLDIILFHTQLQSSQLSAFNCYREFKLRKRIKKE